SAQGAPSAAAGSVIHCRRSECWRALSAAGRVYPFVSHGISYAAIYQKPILRRPVRAVRHLHCIACRNSCGRTRSEAHTSELQSRENLVCRLLLEKKKDTVLTVS